MKFTICLATTLLALCLVLKPSSATYRGKLRLSRDVTAVIEELRSVVEDLKDTLNSVKDGAKESEALMQMCPDDSEACIQQAPSVIFQLQLALRDLIRIIARLERCIRWERRG